LGPKVADASDMARHEALEKRKAKLTEERAALFEMFRALTELNYQGGFTKRQRIKNSKRLQTIVLRLNGVHMSILTLKDTPTPK
jgi:hypothetical protein